MPSVRERRESRIEANQLRAQLVTRSRVAASSTFCSSATGDAGRLDSGRPFFYFTLNEHLQVLGRPAIGSDDFRPDLPESSLNGGRVEGGNGGCVEVLDDRRRRILGQKHAGPTRVFKIGEALLTRTRVCRREGRAIFRKQCDRLHMFALDVSNCG